MERGRYKPEIGRQESPGKEALSEEEGKAAVTSLTAEMESLLGLARQQGIVRTTDSQGYKVESFQTGGLDGVDGTAIRHSISLAKYDDTYRGRRNTAWIHGYDPNARSDIRVDFFGGSNRIDRFEQDPIPEGSSVLLRNDVADLGVPITEADVVRVASMLDSIRQDLEGR